MENGGREKRRRIGSRTFTFLDLERDGKEWRGREEGSGRNRKVGRQAIPACSVQECDSIGFRYLSIPDTRQHFSNRYQTSFVLQPLPPLIKRISPIERTPRPRERARGTPESLHGVGGSSTERMNRARSSRDAEYVNTPRYAIDPPPRCETGKFRQVFKSFVLLGRGRGKNWGLIKKIFFLRIVIYTIYVYVAFLTADNFIA